MLSLFLGAGFSKWAADLPAAIELFDFRIEAWGPRDARKLDLVRSLKQEWDSANPKGLPEEFIASALHSGEENKKALIWYIARRLSEPFIWSEFHAGRCRRHVLMIDENRKLGIPGLTKAADFIRRFTNRDCAGIITANYDMLVEYGLGTKGFNYGVSGQVLTGRWPYPVSQWLHPVTLTGKLPLAKIHGSISWNEHACYTDGRGGITGNALIVAPTPEKKPPPSLGSVWELAASILQRTSHLVVFGFAFNPYDEPVLRLLSSGAALESVLVVDVESRIERASELWPEASFFSAQPPPRGDASIERWLRSSDICNPRSH